MQRWVREVYMLARDGRAKAALGVIYRNVNDMMCAGMFDDVDELLATVDVSRLGPDEALGFSCITFAAKDKLKRREEYIDLIAKVHPSLPAAVIRQQRKVA